MKNVLSMNKWIEVLHYIYNNPDNTALQLSIDKKITYSHVHRVIKALKDRGILKIEKVGRDNKITLTVNGEIVGESITKMYPYIK